jgi:hypothetical protein
MLDPATELKCRNEDLIHDFLVAIDHLEEVT